MKAIIFLCLALVISCQKASPVSRADILSLLQADYTVDTVLELFQQLKANQQNSLSTLDANYQAADQTLTGEIARTANRLSDKLAQCQNDDDAVSKETNNQEKLKKNIEDAQNNILSNQDKAKQAAELRCASSLNAISQVAKKQEQVEFLLYLRSRVADPAFADYINSQNGAFLQIKTALASNQEGEILSLIAKHHMISMIQKSGKKQADYQGESDLGSELNARSRTAEEVGTDYIDNDRGALQVQGVDGSSQSVESIVQDLLNAIDKLIASHQAEIATVQEGETKAVQAFIDYKRQLEDQNYVLQKYIDAASAAYDAHAAILGQNGEVANQCRSEVPGYQQEAQGAQDAKAAADQQYATKRSNIVDALALLDQVIQVYTEEVVNQASNDERYRADDYLDNQSFDNSFGNTA